MIRKFFSLPAGRVRPRAAVFMSGSGSNAEALLRLAANGGSPEYEIACVVTDNPEKSRARELAGQFDVPLVEFSIREFYHRRGEKRVSLATERCREIRDRWSEELCDLVLPFDVDFGIFAGFMPLCSLPGKMPCLNVHPGDLTVVGEHGERLLVGLNTKPVERAILMGKTTLRSSVMITQVLAADGSNVDAGPLLAVSPEMPIDFRGMELEQLKAVAAARPEQRPMGGYKDALEELAAHNQELLKYAGDHVVLPRAARYFAAGMYAQNEAGELLFLDGESWRRILTVECSADGGRNLITL